MDTLWGDTLGYAGAKMIRRIVGISHVADIEGIESLEMRALIEKRALLMAREMVLASGAGADRKVQGLGGVEEFVVMARRYSTMAPAGWAEEKEEK
jgi:5-methylthioribose kinase